MEQARRFYGGAALGERNLEWDLNNWKWDGDLFIARQLDPASVPSNFNGQSSNTSSSCSEPEIQKGNLDRKRRAIVVDDEEDDDEGGTLSLKLGQSQLDGTIGKRTKFGGGGGGFLNRAACQVEGCCADLSIAKDYHRRHKVCEMHSKVSKALVGNVMQRFCQQCSRFHLLQEFDEGKRSCRRRLAGHNKRRRKTQPETLMSGQPAGGEQASNYILISLLRLLSNMQSNNRSDSNTDQDLVARLLRSLVSQSGSNGFGAINEGNMGRISALPSGTPPRPPRPTSTHLGQPALAVPHKPMQAASSEKSDGVFLKDSPPTSSEVRDSVVTTTKLNSFDLNNIYIDSDDSQHSSPPQVSGNSDSASAPSPSSSAGEAQGRTDRIVFKLFGKEPSDFPMVLRGQILDWLAHSPTDIESYIRPGCVILTIYLRLAEPIWEELSSDLGSSLSRLLDITEEPFWRSGWVYTRVENRIVFCYNGRIVIDKSLPSQDSCCSRILSVTPIAVSISERARFQITGYNLSNPSTRFLCALEGEYLALEPHQDSTTDNSIECLDLSCSIPSVTGRGFIEVEDEGLSSGFFPFIVAESDVCSEIRMLESILESTDSQELSRKWEARQQAMDFIHEMGWLLHRCQSKSRLGHQNPNTEPFSLTRFRQLMEFSMDHDWCAVVKKLLDILVEGSVSHGEHPSLDAALSEMRLLHRAVRRNCRALVDLLLRYIPVSSSKDSGEKLLFRPDVKGPAGLTPLHIAAGRDFSEAVLDALTDDPGKVGIEAWKSARDSTGATPEDYARLRGHYTYIRMVERKISRRSSTGCVVINIPEDTSTRGSSNRLGIGVSSLEITTVLSRSLGRSCKGCENKIAYGVAGRSRAYRPAMLSMVAIAAVCVCVALFFKTSPVVYLFRPFCWESLHFGSI